MQKIEGEANQQILIKKQLETFEQNQKDIKETLNYTRRNFSINVAILILTALFVILIILFRFL